MKYHIVDTPKTLEEDCKLNYIKPKYTFLDTKMCMVHDCENNKKRDSLSKEYFKNYSQFVAYTDHQLYNYPGAVWVFCPEHLKMGNENIVKYGIASMCSPISSYFDQTINYNGKDMLIRMFRVSKNQFAGKTVVTMYYDGKLYHILLSEVEDEIKKLKPRKLTDWEIRINDEYYKYVPKNLLDKFPAWLFE